MARKSFFSSFYKGEIVKPDDPRYWEKAKAEALYQYFDLVERNCSCFDCKNKKERLYQFIWEKIFNRKPVEEKQNDKPT